MTEKYESGASIRSGIYAGALSLAVLGGSFLAATRPRSGIEERVAPEPVVVDSQKNLNSDLLIPEDYESGNQIVLPKPYPEPFDTFNTKD